MLLGTALPQERKAYIRSKWDRRRLFYRYFSKIFLVSVCVSVAFKRALRTDHRF